jgi:hypothetical protein
MKTSGYGMAVGGKFKDATGRGFRSCLELSAAAQSLPLGFHCRELSLGNRNVFSSFA